MDANASPNPKRCKITSALGCSSQFRVGEMLEGWGVGDSWGSSLHRAGSHPGFGPAALPLHPFPPLRDHFHGALEGPIQPPPLFRLGWRLQICHPKLCKLQKPIDLLRGQSRRKEKRLGTAGGGSVPTGAGGKGCVCPSSGRLGCCAGRCRGTAHSGCSMGTASRPFACWAPASPSTSTGEWDAPTLPFLPPFLHLHHSPHLYPPVYPSANPLSSFSLLLPQNPQP